MVPCKQHLTPHGFRGIWNPPLALCPRLGLLVLPLVTWVPREHWQWQTWEPAAPSLPPSRPARGHDWQSHFSPHKRASRPDQLHTSSGLGISDLGAIVRKYCPLPFRISTECGVSDLGSGPNDIRKLQWPWDSCPCTRSSFLFRKWTGTWIYHLCQILSLLLILLFKWVHSLNTGLCLFKRKTLYDCLNVTSVGKGEGLKKCNIYITYR